jgi:hypothetical protein
MVRKLVILGAIGLVLAVVAPLGSNAAVFDYYRNNSLINGQIRGNCGYQCVTSWYRAGSGSGTDACQTNNWIPLGGFNVNFHSDNYAGSLIQGRVWSLSDYQCSNGVIRTELFVHSQETSSQGQQCPSGTPDFCWDTDNDYYSNGCIKVARMPVVNGYSDLGRIDEFHHSLSGPVTQVWVSA